MFFPTPLFLITSHMFPHMFPHTLSHLSGEPDVDEGSHTLARARPPALVPADA